MMSEDVLKLCRIYHERVSLILPDRRYFFPNQFDRQYSPSFLRSILHECWDKMKTNTVKGTSPHVHDFRHNFAIKRLNLWIQEGKDLQAYLPYLSVYLGHASLSETDYYLHLVPEFFPVMISRGEERFSYLIPEATNKNR
jgi:integrase